MLIRTGDIFNGYTKVDKQVFTNPYLTNGAKVLYGYLSGLKSGQNFSDKYIMKALGISQQILTKRKKELKEQNLIMVKRIAARIYVMYIGNSKMSVHATERRWDEIEDVVDEERGND